MNEKNKLPSNVSPEVLARLERINSYNTPFVNGITDFNYTLGVPLIAGGFAFLFFDRLPNWFSDDDVMKNFQSFFQKNFRSYQGSMDVTSQPLTYQAGAVGYTIPIPGDLAAPSSEFTTTYLEHTGSPGKALIERWFNAIHDINTGHSLLGDMGIDYGDPMNWTADVLYIEVRKDFKNKEIDPIEFAAYWRGVFPTNIPTIGDHNYTIGQQNGPVEGTINWVGVQDISPRVKKYALTVLREHILNPTSKFYIKLVDSSGVDREASDTITEDDILFKIYGNSK